MLLHLAIQCKTFSLFCEVWKINITVAISSQKKMVQWTFQWKRQYWMLPLKTKIFVHEQFENGEKKQIFKSVIRKIGCCCNFYSVPLSFVFRWKSPTHVQTLQSFEEQRNAWPGQFFSKKNRYFSGRIIMSNKTHFSTT